jgi:hypothetical protein
MTEINLNAVVKASILRIKIICILKTICIHKKQNNVYIYKNKTHC